MNIRNLIIAILVFMSTAGVRADAPLTYFLKLDGVDGESTEKGHEKEIVLNSFLWGGVSNPVAGSPTASGKVSVGDITVTKHVDKSSPKLMLSCVKGSHITEGTITVRKAGSGGVDFLVITLKDVVVTSFQTGGDGGSTVDKVTITFSGLTLQTADGTSGDIQVDPIGLE
jgi:type VI secretion system secreted protein Hcp